MSRIDKLNLERYTENVKTYVNKAYPALTDEQIDGLWAEAPVVNTLPDFTMTPGFVPMWNGTTFTDGAALTDLTKVDTDQILQVVQSQTINFGNGSYSAKDKVPIKRNGYYMVYCNNPKLKVIEIDAFGNPETIISDAKQIALMATPIIRKPDAITFGASGNYWTGDNLSVGLNGFNIPVEGFRTSLREGSYIACDEAFWVSQMVKGELSKPLTTNILFIGNSHSQDTFMPFAEVFNAEGENNFVFGLCKKEGSSAKDHSKNIQNNIADYHYYESTPNDKGTYSNPFGRDDDGKLTRVTMDKILTAQNWDYVFIQSCPGDYVDDTVFC